MNDTGSNTRLDIDLAFYRSQNADLDVLTDDQLVQHYHLFGEEEGRVASPLCIRDFLLSEIKASDVLEIGPYCQPTIRGPNVRYFEVLDSAGLVARAASLGFHGAVAPYIDYVSPTGDLSIVEDSAFDFVFSSHCIEHQPDLIRHLNQVARILRPNGRYILIIPDKRYCLDHYIAPSTVADVIQAGHERRITHTLGSIVTESSLLTHNDTERHWAGDHGTPHVFEDPGVITNAINRYHEACGGYIDTHAWRFTPRSFRDIVTQLLAVNLITLSPYRVLGTCRNTNSFIAILIPVAS